MADARLVLVRHAKAEQGGRDVDRPLNARGRADAAAVGRWLRDQSLVPDRALVSPSRRTRQTWQLCAAAAEADIDEAVEAGIYSNSVDNLRRVIADGGGDAMTLALVGHNPSVHELTLELAGRAGAEELQEFPTATVAVFSVAGGWADLSDATLISVATCRG